MRRKATTLPMKSLDLASLVPQQASDHYDQRQCHIDLIRTCRWAYCLGFQRENAHNLYPFSSLARRASKRTLLIGQLCKFTGLSTLLNFNGKSDKKIIKKFTKATHGHPLFIKILFENLTFFTQGNGITRLWTFERRWLRRSWRFSSVFRGRSRGDEGVSY